MAGITQKVQLFNDALKLVMLHVEEAGPLKSGSTSIAETLVRMASRVAKHMPMQLSSSNQNEQRVTYGYAPEQEPRAAGIFRLFP